MKNTSKWTTQPPDNVDCENMAFAIAQDHSVLAEVVTEWRGGGLTTIKAYARPSGALPGDRALAQAMVTFPSKSTTSIQSRVWSLLFDLYLQLDALDKGGFAPTMPNFDANGFAHWRKNR